VQTNPNGGYRMQNPCLLVKGQYHGMDIFTGQKSKSKFFCLSADGF
jgi:hypothetical protein